MNICVDVGNTTITFAEFENDEITFKVQIRYDLDMKANDFVDFLIRNMPSANKIDEVTSILVSSVVPEINQPLIDGLTNLYGKAIKTIDLRTMNVGFNFKIDNPLETGGDLIADLAGGYKKYGAPLLVVDLGTASKVLYLDKKACFSSANILPGVMLCRNSLNRNTSLLPRIELFVPNTVIAKNTVDAMNTGIVYGHVDMVEGTLNRYRKETGEDIKVVVTGGHMKLLKPAFNQNYIFDENLTLAGLNVISNLNK